MAVSASPANRTGWHLKNQEVQISTMYLLFFLNITFFLKQGLMACFKTSVICPSSKFLHVHPRFVLMMQHNLACSGPSQ